MRISTTTATPGYLAGPLPAGEWTVQIDTHMIMPGEPVRTWLDVTIGRHRHDDLGAHVSDALRGNAAPGSGRGSSHGPGWYRGDLHSHSNHSDAGERTVAELVDAARAAGLDFIFLTDHNTTSGLPEMDASTTPELLAAGGVELTTFWGHTLCLGAREWVDWRIRPGSGEMARIAAAAYASDQAFIIAHPLAAGDPDCTGCAWRFGEMMPGNARLVEIWNGPWHGDSHNEAALALWYDWLNQGLRLAATAGSDTHGRHDYATRDPRRWSALRRRREQLRRGRCVHFGQARSRVVVGEEDEVRPRHTPHRPARTRCAHRHRNGWSGCGDRRDTSSGRGLDARCLNPGAAFPRSASSTRAPRSSCRRSRRWSRPATCEPARRA